MPDIPTVGVNSRIRGLNVRIPEISDWSRIAPVTASLESPVTVIIGVPVVDIPGCVESHRDSKKSKTLPTDDSRGLQILCDAGMPSFNPVDYTPEELILTAPASVPKIGNNEKEEDQGDDDGATPPPADIPNIVLPCPLPGSPVIGALNNSRTKRITGYVRKSDGSCETQYMNLPIAEIVGEQLPDIPIVITTAAIAAVATTSALLAKPLGDYLLKVVKPTVKKILKKIAAIRGKQKILSTSQKRAEQRSSKK